MWSILISFFLAYLFFPLIIKLERRGIKRQYSTLIAIIISTIVSWTLVFMLIPNIYLEVKELSERFPNYVDQAILKTDEFLSARGIKFEIDRAKTIEKLQEFSSNLSSESVRQISNNLTEALSSTVNFIVFILQLTLVPLFFYFIIMRYEKIINFFLTLVPLRHRRYTNKFLSKINNILIGYIRGQFFVSICLVFFYALFLSLADLKFGMLIGIITGFLYYVPYLGALGGFITSVIVGLSYYDNTYNLIGIVLIFTAAQFIEGIFLTPKIVGDRVGLHPLEVMIAITVFGNFFGIIGMVIAIPTTSILKFMITELLAVYQNSHFYNKN